MDSAPLVLDEKFVDDLADAAWTGTSLFADADDPDEVQLRLEKELASAFMMQSPDAKRMVALRTAKLGGFVFERKVQTGSVKRKV